MKSINSLKIPCLTKLVIIFSLMLLSPPAGFAQHASGTSGFPCVTGSTPGCDWDISVRQCHKAGLQPVYDSCGVCGGNGASCLNAQSVTIQCVNFDLVNILVNIDTSFFTQKKIIETAIKKALASGRISAKDAKKFKTEANSIYKKAWTLTWSLQVLAKTCNGTNCYARAADYELSVLKASTKSFEILAGKVAKFLPKKDRQTLTKKIAAWSISIKAILPELKTCPVNPTPLPTGTPTPQATATATVTPVITQPAQEPTFTPTATPTSTPTAPPACSNSFCSLKPIQSSISGGICKKIYYSDTVIASPAGSYNYTLNGQLPFGLNYDSSTGIISGKSNAAGTFIFNVTAKGTIDSCEVTCYRDYSIFVGCCQNGAVDVGEECDDGNSQNGDKCDFNCTKTRCGNGVVSFGEECDDGNTNNHDSCNNFCKINC